MLLGRHSPEWGCSVCLVRRELQACGDKETPWAGPLVAVGSSCHWACGGDSFDKTTGFPGISWQERGVEGLPQTRNSTNVCQKVRMNVAPIVHALLPFLHSLTKSPYSSQLGSTAHFSCPCNQQAFQLSPAQLSHEDTAHRLSTNCQDLSRLLPSSLIPAGSYSLTVSSADQITRGEMSCIARLHHSIPISP